MVEQKQSYLSESPIPEWFFNIEETESLPEKFLGTNFLQYTSSTVVIKIYLLGRALGNVFEKHGLKYWTSGGTTLGIVRHSGLIPWDDDLDLCMMDDQVDLFHGKVAGDLKKNYNIIFVEPTAVGYRLFHATDSTEVWKTGSKQEHRYPFCDLFVMRKIPGKPKQCEIRDRAGRVLWPEETYLIEDVEKAQLMKFGDFKLRCPNNAEEYLNKTYGLDWRCKGKTHNYCHLTQKFMNTEVFSIKDYSPALPLR